MKRLLLFPLLALLALAACGPTYQPMGPVVGAPRLTPDHFVAADGYRLPVRRWLPDGEPIAAVVALHGFNDYSMAFEVPAPTWTAAGVAVIAYDQRGFGATERPGIWPGTETLVADLSAVVDGVRREFPGIPVYVLGESMGGAVVLAALGSDDPPAVDGAVLVAPAALDRDALSPYQQAMMWWAVNVMPWLTSRGEGIVLNPTDNRQVRIDLWHDPLVIKDTRADAVVGLVNLMDAALAAAPLHDVPTLVLYGDNERVVPPAAIASLLDRLRPDRRQVAFYARGYHMLLRDIFGRTVAEDIAAWVADPGQGLPSGADRRGPPEAVAALRPR